jgi:hypothetical protein
MLAITKSQVEIHSGQVGEGRMTKPDREKQILRDSLRLPLFRWRKTNRSGETEILVGPSVAWLFFAIVTLLLKGLGLATLVQALWKSFPW